MLVGSVSEGSVKVIESGLLGRSLVNDSSVVGESVTVRDGRLVGTSVIGPGVMSDVEGRSGVVEGNESVSDESGVRLLKSGVEIGSGLVETSLVSGKLVDGKSVSAVVCRLVMLGRS